MNKYKTSLKFMVIPETCTEIVLPSVKGEEEQP